MSVVPSPPPVGPINLSYRNRLRADMRNSETWAVHLEPQNIHRTEAGLRALVKSIDIQIKDHGDSSTPGFDPDWYQRATRLRGLVGERLAQVESMIDTVLLRRKDYQRLLAEREHMTNEITALKKFAWDLGVELEKSGPQGVVVLHEIEAPFPSTAKTAFGWLEEREGQE